MIIVALDLRDIFHFLFNGTGINTRGKRVAALFLSLFILKTLVLVLLWVGGRGLVSGRWLFLTKYVSKGGVGRLIFFSIFLLFFCRPVSLETLDVNFTDT